jgi:hypothetical protein
MANQVVTGLWSNSYTCPRSNICCTFYSFSREPVCHVHLGSFGGTTWSECKIERTHMGTTIVAKALTTRIQALWKLWNQIPCYCGAL